MGDAVGISVVDAVPMGVAPAPAPASHCAFVGMARRGARIAATSDDISCRIARFVLGCASRESGAEAAARSFVESKLMPDLASALRFVAGFPVLEPRPRVFVYFPLDRAPLVPDLVVRFLRPEEAMQCLRRVATASGERADVRTAGAAAVCADCTAGPLCTGRAAFSPGCPGSRRETPLAPDETLVSLPARLERLAFPSL